jgi:hypothetical protein
MIDPVLDLRVTGWEHYVPEAMRYEQLALGGPNQRHF